MNSPCIAFARRPVERVDAIVYARSTPDTGSGDGTAPHVGTAVPSGDSARHATILPLLKPNQS